jgi:hypothetical protein
MIEIISTDVAAVAAKFKELRESLLAETEKGMGRALLFLKGRVQEGIRSGTKVEGQLRAVRRRSGMLSGSVNTRTKISILTVLGFIGAHAPQSRMLNDGAEGAQAIVPRNKKWLTIPFPGGPALTPAGVPRGRARDFDLRFVPSGKDAMTAYLMGGTRQEPILYYVLKKKVEIKETRWLSGPVKANEAKVTAYLDKSTGDAVKKAGL